MEPTKILLIAGTRPEIIKLAPVYLDLKTRPVDVELCVTAQHRGLLDQMLHVFGMVADYDLDLMRSGESLADLGARALGATTDLLSELHPDRVVVQGDTTSAAMASIAAHHHSIPVAHVEAGLRTYDRLAPFPEESNRRIIAAVSDLHFAPSEEAARALLAEGFSPGAVHMVGNTIADALELIAPIAAGCADPILQRLGIEDPRSVVMVTLHRREGLGGGFRRVCAGVAELSTRFAEAQFVLPVHPNPSVAAEVGLMLSNISNVHLIEPLDYLTFIDLLRQSQLVITDSGGVQEEAPALGVHALVVREKTERREGIDAGVATLVGFDSARLVAEAARILASPTTKVPRALYGDGLSAARIGNVLVGLA
ncbi:MAG: non-hydrolyzing UDP-N-acetylglucosamine 2-epimerase [Acidimicrobiales bacterium]